MYIFKHASTALSTYTLGAVIKVRLHDATKTCDIVAHNVSFDCLKLSRVSITVWKTWKDDSTDTAS